MKKLLFLGLFIFSMLNSWSQTDAQRAVMQQNVAQWTTQYQLSAAQTLKANEIQLQKFNNTTEVEAAAKSGALTEYQRLQKIVSLNEGAMASLALGFDKQQLEAYHAQRTRLRTLLNKEKIAQKNAQKSASEIELYLLHVKSEFVW
jgi:hypothetical protein